jgi:O-antigen/teichoic acid export membrane protein
MMGPALVIVWRIVLLGLWFGVTALIARSLGAAEFGIYVFCITLIRLFSSFIADTLDLAVLRRAPVYLLQDRPRAIALVRSAFWLRLVLGGSAALAVVLAAPWLAERFLDSAGLADLVVLAAAGIVGDLLMRAGLVYFQAGAEFRRFILVDGIGQLGRAALIGALIATGELNARTAVAIYVVTPFVAFAVALALAPGDMYGKVAPGGREVRDILRFGRWMVPAAATAAVSERMETFMVGFFLTPAELGQYGAALILATIPEFIEGAVGTVLMPKVAQLHSQGRIAEVQRWYRRWSVPACALVLLLVWLLGDWAIATFLPADFARAGAVFKVQMIGAMFWLALVPVSAMLLAFASPKRLAVINLSGLVVRTLIGVALVPVLGVMGAGVVFMLMRIGMGTAVMVMAGRLMTAGVAVVPSRLTARGPEA